MTLGIDPGPKNKGCGFALIDDEGVLLQSGVSSTKTICEFIPAVDRIVIEMISCYGMAVGMSTFQTLIEAGRIIQCALSGDETEKGIYLIPRKDIKMVICGTSQAKDANVRQALLNLYASTGAGKVPQIGTKGQPGPLYGMSTHAWPALAAALAYHRMPIERASMNIESFRYTEKKWFDFVWEENA